MQNKICHLNSLTASFSFCKSLLKSEISLFNLSLKAVSLCILCIFSSQIFLFFVFSLKDFVICVGFSDDLLGGNGGFLETIRSFSGFIVIISIHSKLIVDVKWDRLRRLLLVRNCSGMKSNRMEHIYVTS